MDWSYMAGFFDGEGSVIMYKPKCNPEDSRYTCVRLQIGQTDEDTHNAICEFLISVGIDYTTFTDTGRNKDGYKTCYYIKIGRAESIMEFCSKVIPRSITKWRKLEEAVEVIGQRTVEAKIFESEVLDSIRLEVLEIVKLSNGGMSQREIANLLGKSHGTVYNRLKRFTV